ncbi:hypothetical protein HKD37_04G009432 [Glycine soja]
MFDATGRIGFSPLQKCIVAIQVLIYRSLANIVDDYVRIGVKEIFVAKYLRRPNNNDILYLLQIGEACDFLSASNDINFVNQSHLFNYNMQGEALMVQYRVNETQYNMGYYLAYGI